MPIFSGIIRFLGLIMLLLFQVLVLNDLHAGPYIHPYVYPMFIIMLPFRTPDWLLMIFAFAVGITVDMFSNTPGMHAAASVAMAYFRPVFVKIYTPITGYEKVSAPSISELGFIWFLLFSLTLIFIHHAIYFLILIFWPHHLGQLFLKILLSTLVSTLLTVILAYLFSGRKAKS
jgi:rod shape-determining protein MreD